MPETGKQNKEGDSSKAEQAAPADITNLSDEDFARYTRLIAGDKDIQSLANSARGQKGWSTQQIKQANNLLKKVQRNDLYSVAIEEELIDVKNGLKESMGKYRTLVTRLMFLDGSKIAEYEEKLEEEGDRVDSAIQEIVLALGVLEEKLRPIRATTRAGDHVPAETQPTKTVLELKPKTLTRNHTPVELKVWLKRFSAYYVASRMERKDILEQQAHFMSCVDEYLEQKIRSKIEDITPVREAHGIRSCISTLKEYFLLQFPQFSRTLDFFKLEHKHGQLFSDFVAALNRRGDEADLTRLDDQSIYVFRYIATCKDAELRKEFLKVEQPTKDALEKVVTNYERSKTTVKSIEHDSGGCRSNRVGFQYKKPYNVKRQGGQRRPKTAYRKQQDYKKTGKCIRCGGKYSQSHKCTARHAKCNKCGKQGHYASVCKSGGQKRYKKTAHQAKAKPKAKARSVTVKQGEGSQGPSRQTRQRSD